MPAWHVREVSPWVHISKPWVWKPGWWANFLPGFCFLVSCISDPCGCLGRNLLEVRTFVKDAVCVKVTCVSFYCPSRHPLPPPQSPGAVDLQSKVSELRIPTSVNREGVLSRTSQDQLWSSSNQFFFFSLIREKLNITGVLSSCSELLAGIDECSSTSSPYPPLKISSLFCFPSHHYLILFIYEFCPLHPSWICVGGPHSAPVSACRSVQSGSHQTPCRCGYSRATWPANKARCTQCCVLCGFLGTARMNSGLIVATSPQSRGLLGYRGTARAEKVIHHRPNYKDCKNHKNQAASVTFLDGAGTRRTRCQSSFSPALSCWTNFSAMWGSEDGCRQPMRSWLEHWDGVCNKTDTSVLDTWHPSAGREKKNILWKLFWFGRKWTCCNDPKQECWVMTLFFFLN